MQPTTTRIASVDIVRALTVILMIFVNDLWSIRGVPHWMEHAAYNEDMLGLSDVVFPSFLFILGMSVPLALEARIGKGDSVPMLLRHIAGRSFALLVMGVFSVNIGSGLAGSVPIGRSVFSLVMLVCFFALWNNYRKTDNRLQQKIRFTLKLTAAVVLAVLAFIYRDPDGGIFQPRWWGILGLIGWTYLPCATIYLFARKSQLVLGAATLIFMAMCIAGSNKCLGVVDGILPGNGCLHAFTMCGLLLTRTINRYGHKLSTVEKAGWFLMVGAVFLALGWMANKWWIVSKLQATPPWLFYCTGISVLLYFLIYLIADVRKKANWFNLIKPAGTSTLTCYLVPSFLYALFALTGFKVTGFMSEGIWGLAKCALFALVAVGITALLGRVGVKLKI
jgi:predicted acyltransferase